MLSYFKGWFGNSSSAFLKALSRGDTEKAGELYRTKEQLRENIDPSLRLGPDHEDNTYLHYAALYGMKDMYFDLLSRHGMPDMKNSQRRNCLHLICLGQKINDQVKQEMLTRTLEEGLRGMDLQHILGEKDKDGNTVLHLAAGEGLKQCVDLLLTYNADMVATNEEGLTPADLAKAKQHGNIASSLEAKMVFSQEDELTEPVNPDPDPEVLQEIASGPVGMQDKDLRSMKDALLIETSEMLGVGLQSAEVLLRKHGWSKETLLQAWIENPEQVCEEAKVDMPGDGGLDYLGGGNSVPALPAEAEEGEVRDCGICYESGATNIQIPCGHHFCDSCWKEYLEDKITVGQSQEISCPEYGCYKLVPLEVIESVVSQEMALKFLSFDIKAFVDSNPNIRWCPHPGCSQALNKPQDQEDALSPTHTSSKVKGQTVHCGNGHYFCWACLGDAHEPCSCEQWSRWLQHCEEMKDKVGNTTAAEANEAASSKWLANYSKPCPKCNSPIEKTEGCNHMCCKHCRHDFCWVCLDDWKCHNSATGGYFNCNRYDAQRKAGNLLDHRRQEVMNEHKDWEEVSKFLHYHERYKEHINSYKLEVPFLDKAQEKMIELATSIQRMECSPMRDGSQRHASVSTRIDLSFIEDAVLELLKCRRILKATYCYGYYLTGIVSKKQFEHMQGALEQVTEMLAEAVARPHLRKPRVEIIRLTREAREKRTALVKNVYSGLPLSYYPFDGITCNTTDPRLKRFLHDLDTYKPSRRGVGRFSERLPERRRHRHHHQQQADSDSDLLQVLELSRREYEADKQLAADMNLAKTLSLQLAPHQRADPAPPSPPPPPPPPRPPVSSRGSFPREDSMNSDWWTVTEPTPSWPILKLDPAEQPRLSPISDFSPPDPLDDPPVAGSPLTPHTPPWTSTEWGPIYGEAEDLHKAIRDSLRDISDTATNQGHTAHTRLLPNHNLGLLPDTHFGTQHYDQFNSEDSFPGNHRQLERYHPHSHGELLVTGQPPSKPKKASRAEELVHPTSRTHHSRHDMLQFSGPHTFTTTVPPRVSSTDLPHPHRNVPGLFTTNDRDLPSDVFTNDSTGDLPPSLRQLFQNHDNRAGSNV